MCPVESNEFKEEPLINTDLSESYNEVVKKSLDLVEVCQTAMVGSNDENGYPNIKAMFKIGADGLNTVWFSTNTSSKRVSQFKKDPRACVYFIDHDKIMGLMLIGEIEIISDLDTKKRFWSDGCERYYPLGVNDPDYSILRFTAKSGNYYHGLKNTSFIL